MNETKFDICQTLFQLFDHVAESLAVTGLDGRFLYVNRAGTMFGGRHSEEVQGKLVWEVYPDIADSLYEQEFWRAVREQIPVAFEYYYPSQERWFEVRFYPSAEAVAIFGIDITERKHAQETVRLYEQKYQLLIEAVDQGFCVIEMIWDENGSVRDYRFLEVNAAFERMSGLANVIGKTAIELIPHLEAWGFERFGQIARSGESMHLQHFSNALGRAFDLFASALNANHLVILFADITEEMQQKQEKVALNEALLISSIHQQEMTDTANDMNVRLRRAMQETHHRVKNNLQVISSLVEMQAADMESEAAIPLHRIKQHVQALAAIHELLTKQTKSGGDTEYIGTQAIMETLLPLINQTLGTRNLAANIVDVILTAEKAASFALLVSECISNAIKHCTGDIEISLRVADKRAILEVCDSGNGFPPDFDPRKAANTGLTLIESVACWDLRGNVQYDNHGLGGGRVTVMFPITSPPHEAVISR